MSLFAAVYAQAADKTSEPKVKVDDKSFKCINDMTPVRHFLCTFYLEMMKRRWRLRRSARATSTRSFYVRELPGDLSANEKIGLVAVLIKSNLLRLAS
jgi:hypothetical protein